VAVTLVWPAALVTAGVVSVAPAPEPGGVKVIVVPMIGFPYVSVRVTVNGVAKGVFTNPSCGVLGLAVSTEGAAALTVVLDIPVMLVVVVSVAVIVRAPAVTRVAALVKV
jgi:hypothetical protein